MDRRFSCICKVAPVCPPMWVHWRHLANTIELLLPSAQPSPQPKWQIDLFSLFCTAHGRKSIYFTMGAHLPESCPFPWWYLDLHLIHGSLGQHESSTQTASQMVQPFLQHSLVQQTTDLQTTLLGR